MIEVRQRAALGSSTNDSLHAFHHFSFARYQEFAWTQWGELHCLNHEILAPRAELRPQPIDHTEIVTLVRKGVIAHAGSLGGKSRAVAGEVQLISSGEGMTHAYVNPGNRAAEYLEIRIASSDSGAPQRHLTRFPGRKQAGQLMVLASGFAEDREALAMRAEARVMGTRLPAGQTVRYRLAPGRHAYVVTLCGAIAVDGLILEPAGGAAIVDEYMIRIDAVKAAEFLLIDTR